MATLDDAVPFLASVCFLVALLGSRFLRGFLTGAKTFLASSPTFPPTPCLASCGPFWGCKLEWGTKGVWVAGFAGVGELGVGGEDRPGDELARPFSRTLGTSTIPDMTAAQSEHHVQAEAGFVLQTAGNSGRLCMKLCIVPWYGQSQPCIEIEPTDAAATMVAMTSNQEGKSRP